MRSRQNGWHQSAGLPVTAGDLSSPQAGALPALGHKGLGWPQATGLQPKQSFFFPHRNRDEAPQHLEHEGPYLAKVYRLGALGEMSCQLPPYSSSRLHVCGPRGSVLSDRALRTPSRPICTGAPGAPGPKTRLPHSRR